MGLGLSKKQRYQKLIETIFLERYSEGAQRVAFLRSDIVSTAEQLGVELPKNLGDVVYMFRYRRSLPESIRSKLPEGRAWAIKSEGRSRYAFVAVEDIPIVPTLHQERIKIPDATPGIVAKYVLSDEQALLARVRYNRLIDIFMGVTCYSLQSHLRTTVPAMGQVETDEIYVGVNSDGAHFVFPVQAKGGTDQLGITQIEQDFAICAHKFPGLICKPVGAQFLDHTTIVLFEFVSTDEGVRIRRQAHYRLVAPDDLTDEELRSYASSYAADG